MFAADVELNILAAGEFVALVLFLCARVMFSRAFSVANESNLSALEAA